MRRGNTRNEAKFGNSGRRTRSSRTSTLESIQVRPSILIVCEGEKTEPNYFRAFRITNAVYGEGLETIRVVEETQRINDQDGPFDQVWCVFDRDSFPPDHFDNAINKVNSLTDKGFRVAYSNEAFELWYILHFEYQDAALSRSSYGGRLSAHLGREYRKGDIEIYRLLQTMGDESLAIRYAQRLRTHHEVGLPHSHRNPETTVDILVQVLRNVQRQRGY